jgi:hypothetical protein
MAQQDANTNMASAEICDRSPLIVVGEVQAIFPFSTETAKTAERKSLIRVRQVINARTVLPDRFTVAQRADRFVGGVPELIRPLEVGSRYVMFLQPDSNRGKAATDEVPFLSLTQFVRVTGGDANERPAVDRIGGKGGSQWIAELMSSSSCGDRR